MTHVYMTIPLLGDHGTSKKLSVVSLWRWLEALTAHTDTCIYAAMHVGCQHSWLQIHALMKMAGLLEPTMLSYIHQF